MNKISTVVLCLLLTFFTTQTLKAQSCSGTVSNGQNLVTNGDFSQGYSGWTYTADPTQTNGYLAFNPPATANFSTPGMIDVGSNPNVFNSAFATFPAHGGSGNMLMVDGICVAGINLWSQSNIPIVPNTNYYFTVWITSMDNLTPYGTLAFNINGTTLSTISAPGVPGEWIQYTAVWNSGLTPPATATISIQNTTLTGCNNGVDFAIDDVSFSPGCNFGSPGPLPNLGQSFSICGKTLPFAINPNFPPATAAANNLTYNWYVNGVLQTASSGLGSSFYNFNINGPGTYAVCVDSAGSCPKTSVLTVTNTYSVNLGPNVTLCNPTSDVLNAGYTGPGVSYQWSKGGTVISGASGSTYLVTTPGSYSVQVTDPVCGVQSSSITITTSAAVPNDSTFCPVSSGGTGITKLSVTGPGKYKWFTAASGGSVVATGSTYTTPPLSAPGPYTYYVQDTSTFAATVAPPASGNGFSNPAGVGPGGNNSSMVVFNALTSFTLNTITVFPYNYYCPSPSTGNANVVNIIIKDASGNTVGTSNYTGQCTGAGQPAAAMIVPVNITVPAGNGYQIMLNTGSSNIALYQNTSMSYPVSYGSVLQIVSNNTSVYNQYYDPTAYPGYFDWNITHGINCGRVPVTATLNCPKCTISTPPTSASVDFPTYCTATTTQITLSATGGAGDSLVWYTGSCGGTKVASNATGAPIVIPAPSTTTTYYARWETKTGCVSTCVSIVVTPSTPPDISAAGSNQNICNANSTTLTGNTPVNGTGIWTVVSGTGTITNTSNAQSTVTGLITGNLVLQWTISNGTCPASSSQVTIHRDSLTSPTTASADFPTFCTAVTTNITLSATGGASDSLIWYSGFCGSVRVGGNNTGAALVIPAPTTSTTYFARWQSNSGCISQCASVLVTPVLPPDVSVAGTNQNACGNTSVILSGNSPINGSGIWTVISGTGTVTNPNSANSSVTGLANGTLILQWTISNSPCPASSSQVTIQRDSLISPSSASVDFPTFCTATTANITLTATGGTSDSLIWYSGSCGSVKIGGNNTGAALVIPAPTTSTTYFARWQSNSGCVSQCASVLVTPSLPPDPSVAGTNQKLCNNTSTVLNANTPVVGQGIWSIVSGNGTITNMNSGSSTVTNLTPGDLILKWTISNGSCPDTSTQVTIHLDTLTIAPVITGLSFDTCSSTGGLIYGVKIDHTPVSVYSWILTGTLDSTQLNSNSVVINTGTGGGIIQLTETNGACVLSSSKTINIQPTVVTPVLGPDITICSNNYALHTPLPVAGYGIWTLSSGIGSFTNKADTLFQISGLANGTNTFTWTVNGCGGPVSASINVTVKASTMIATLSGPMDTLCVNTPRSLNVSVSGGTGNYSYVWFSSDSSLLSTKNSMNAISIKPQSTNIIYYVYAIDNLNPGCNSNIAGVIVTSITSQNLQFNNLITANNDGKNDNFVAREPLENGTYKALLPGAKVEIYNSWGSTVYQSNNYDNSFKGHNLSDGVYYYSVKSGCGGESYKGWVQIIGGE
jgi:hypothetical protein